MKGKDEAAETVKMEKGQSLLSFFLSFFLSYSFVILF
jgi:hypothetical protein